MGQGDEQRSVRPRPILATTQSKKGPVEPYTSLPTCESLVPFGSISAAGLPTDVYTSVPSSDVQELNAITRGSSDSTISLACLRCASYVSRWPGLILDLEIMMSGPDM